MLGKATDVSWVNIVFLVLHIYIYIYLACYFYEVFGLTKLRQVDAHNLVHSSWVHGDDFSDEKALGLTLYEI